MGPPGAGKGTQAKLLADAFDMKHLSSGDILRAEKSSGSDLGKQLAGFMNSGQLVPDETVVSIMAKAITSQPATGGLMLDGFPRTVPQAKTLDEQLSKAGKPLDAVVVVTADEDIIVERITGRRSCPQCGKIFHVKFMPPRTDGVCDACGARLVQRDDDSEAVVRKRLDAYNRQTEPVIDYYRSQAKLQIVQVDGTQPVEQVSGKLISSLKAIGAR